jgi:hypothetical protein
MREAAAADLPPAAAGAFSGTGKRELYPNRPVT